MNLKINFPVEVCSVSLQQQQKTFASLKGIKINKESEKY
jgi:hypothetical protein